jgi:uncharacterized protein YceH (UPF0502 family)
MYPYQLGQNNEEAIASGAFWFYRKLGFRPGRTDLLQLAEREQACIARDANYRTPTRTLRRLAEGHVFYELPGSELGAWDRFSTRNIGLRVSRRMAHQFAGDIQLFRKTAAKNLARLLDASVPATGTGSSLSFENFAMVLSLIPELASWSASEKGSLVEILRAKQGRDEMRYLHLLHGHEKLRAAVLRLGSSP